MKKLNVLMYTDGSYFKDGDAGGWATYIEIGDKITTLSGSQLQTTNNRMEITAVIEGLKVLTIPCRVVVYSDSQYVVNSIAKGWLKRWAKQGWVTSSWKGNQTTPVKNSDLFKELLELIKIHTVQMVWVKAHATDERNNRVDEMAKQAARTLIR